MFEMNGGGTKSGEDVNTSLDSLLLPLVSDLQSHHPLCNQNSSNLSYSLGYARVSQDDLMALTLYQINK